MAGRARRVLGDRLPVLVRTSALVAVASLTTAAVAVGATLAPQPAGTAPRPGAFAGLPHSAALEPAGSRRTSDEPAERAEAVVRGTAPTVPRTSLPRPPLDFTSLDVPAAPLSGSTSLAAQGQEQAETLGLRRTAALRGGAGGTDDGPATEQAAPTTVPVQQPPPPVLPTAAAADARSTEPPAKVTSPPVELARAKPQAPRAKAVQSQPTKRGPEVQKARARTPQAPKAQAPKAQAPRAQAPKPQAPRAQAPRAQAPKAQAPKAQVVLPHAPHAPGGGDKGPDHGPDHGPDKGPGPGSDAQHHGGDGASSGKGGGKG